MELLTKGVIVKSLEDIEIITIRVSENKYPLIKGKLLEQQQVARNITRKMLKEGLINSISRPKNKQHQKDLNKLNLAKRTIKKSLKDLNDFFK